jgi:hypothetical protein
MDLRTEMEWIGVSRAGRDRRYRDAGNHSLSQFQDAKAVRLEPERRARESVLIVRRKPRGKQADQLRQAFLAVVRHAPPAVGGAFEYLPGCRIAHAASRRFAFGRSALASFEV